jgi:outer membrane lipopolysaccharide assembly protein LptE/RlpB
MRSLSIASLLKLAALVAAAALMSACWRGGGTKDHVVQQAANIPASFDVTVLADKDNQFDFDGAPLTSEDLKSAFRYRQEESLPMSSVLLKRGEKQKVKKEHEAALARIAEQMHFKAYVEDSDGVISELQLSGSASESK